MIENLLSPRSKSDAKTDMVFFVFGGIISLIASFAAGPAFIIVFPLLFFIVGGGMAVMVKIFRYFYSELWDVGPGTFSVLLIPTFPLVLLVSSLGGIFIGGCAGWLLFIRNVKFLRKWY